MNISDFSNSIIRRLFQPVDIASIVFFRIAFGIIMLISVYRYFKYDWIRKFWLDAHFHFTYLGFDWVRPWPDNGMYIHFICLGVLAVFITVGFLYRISTFLFFIGFTYIFLLDKATYLNHYYLVCLVSFLMIFVPANRLLSVDSFLKPEIKSNTVSTWSLWLLRFQIGLVYFFSGLAKTNPDWLRGEPMRHWMINSVYLVPSYIGYLFSQEWFVYLATYFGLLLDLCVVPLLLWKPTRIFALCAAYVFHILNWQLFNIGIFPWFMMSATLLFLAPSWPRFGGRLLSMVRYQKISDYKFSDLTLFRKFLLCFFVVYIIVQLFLPLRHYLYPNIDRWTEIGQRYSWRMLLRSKRGKINFVAIDPEAGKFWEVNLYDFLTPWQIKKMKIRPHMIHQFSIFLRDYYQKNGYEKIKIYVNAKNSLNYRRPQWLVDPGLDLSSQPRTFFTSEDWIVPLFEPLPKTLEEGWPPIYKDKKH